MNVYAWPAAWNLEEFSFTLDPNVAGFSSQYTKSFAGIDLIGEAFVMTGRLARARLEDGGAREAYFNRLRGVHYISAWHLVRPQPIGTQRGAPTLSANVAQGASVLPLQGLTDGNTYRAGDMLGVSTQLFQVADDVLISGTTANVNVVNRARKALTSGNAVVWDKPVANWRLTDPARVAYQAMMMLPIDIEMTQTWGSGE